MMRGWGLKADVDAAELARGADGAAPPPAADREPEVVFVGRLSPNKRQDDLIRAFALYQRHHAPRARLRLVGGPLGGAYATHLAGLAEAAGARGVEIGP